MNYFLFFVISLPFISSLSISIYPLQLTANITIISHLITQDTSSSSSYPPQSREIKVYYDYINKLGRIDIKEGYEASKTYYRFYNQKKIEYMIRYEPINDCQRAYLGEKMPFPDISETIFIDKRKVDNVLCNYYVHNDYNTQVHIYIEALTGIPYKLTVSTITTNDFGEITSSVDLITYLYSNVILGPPHPSVFELPEPFASSPTTLCERQVGGFPYYHIFHYFVRL